MPRIYHSLAILSLCLSVFACSDTTQHRDTSFSGTNANTRTLNLETHWQLQRFADTDEALLLSPHSPTLHLQQGRMEGNGGCNRYFGNYLVQGQQIHISLTGSTMMACADNHLMDLEQHYFKRLGQTVSYRVEGETLLLLDGQAKPLLMFRQSHQESLIH